MTAIENAIISGSQYVESLDTLLNSGEISHGDKNTIDSITRMISTVELTSNELYNYNNKEPKGQIITGEFSLKGRHDIIPNSKVLFEIFGDTVEAYLDNLRPAIIGAIKQRFIATDSDILFYEESINFQTDELNFNFAFQTDTTGHPAERGLDIAIFTPARKLTTGYSYRNKVEFSNMNITNIPNEIWDYPCLGFKIPYSVQNDPLDLLGRIIKAATFHQAPGTMADLRFWGPAFRSQVDGFVNILKSYKWKTILTQWDRFYLNPDGQTYRYIKMK